MRGRWPLRILRFVLIAAVFVAVFGLVVMALWNWLVPSLFGGPAITYLQALGILVLSKILLSGFRGGPGRHWGWRHRMAERWEAMTPDEREKFRRGMRGRCGFGPREAEPKAPTT
ncbi:MAG: hypothetical protein KGL02_03020 [Acidobacteriota bacterium]|nr:hypothetical protein [Acidobacteriota bacterium]MDE3170344.1 hypothetical protein [Acidobacteriota bacterium]